VVGGPEGEVLQFTLPSFPPSSNKLYDINHRQRKVYLSDDALIWRTRTTPFVKPCRWPVDWLLKLTLDYEAPNWLTSTGAMRRIDVQNYEKLVIDTLFLKWNTDDSRLVSVVRNKVWGPEQVIRVTLEHVSPVLQHGHAGDQGSTL